MNYENIKEIINKFKNNKSILITFVISPNQEYRLNIKFSLRCINHLLGISKNYLQKEIIDPYKVQNNNFNIEKILKKIKNNKRISDSNKKIISKKINSFSKIFTKIILENDTNKIKIYKNLKFQKYSADYCIEYNNHVIAITINETRENIDHIFHNCYFLSIRTKAILNDSKKINYKFIDIKIISD